MNRRRLKNKFHYWTVFFDGLKQKRFSAGWKQIPWVTSHHHLNLKTIKKEQFLVVTSPDKISCVTHFQSKKSDTTLLPVQLSINQKKPTQEQKRPKKFQGICRNGIHSLHHPAYPWKVFSAGTLLRLVFEPWPWWARKEKKSCKPSRGSNQGGNPWYIRLPDEENTISQVVGVYKEGMGGWSAVLSKVGQRDENHQLYQGN